MTDKLVLAGKEFDSRLIIGTGKYSSGEALTASAKASGAQIATMADIDRITERICRELR